MGSIYDFTGSPAVVIEEEVPQKRSKKRESLTSTERRQANTRLVDMVTQAFNTLQAAMEHADFNTAVKAAQIILDRSGFGPKSTMDVTTLHVDLSALSKEQLAERAMKIAHMLTAAREAVPASPQNTIDVSPTTVN